MKNPFAEKRVKTFEHLQTQAKEWSHAKIISFTPEVRKNKKGISTIHWIPQYEIPDGYTNPLMQDENATTIKRCQLCDTKIIEQGVILHHEKKLCLFVGLDCYEAYESDDHREVRWKLLTQIMDDYFATKLREHKTAVQNLLESYEVNKENERLDYKFYANVKRNRWVDWSKVKTYNFMAKWGWCIKALGFKPELGLVFSFSQYRKYLRSIIEHNLNTEFQKKQHDTYTLEYIERYKAIQKLREVYWKDRKELFAENDLKKLEERAGVTV